MAHSPSWLTEWLGEAHQIEEWDVNEMVQVLLIGSQNEWIATAEKHGFDQAWAERVWKLYRAESS